MYIVQVDDITISNEKKKTIEIYQEIQVLVNTEVFLTSLIFVLIWKICLSTYSDKELLSHGPTFIISTTRIVK